MRQSIIRRVCVCFHSGGGNFELVLCIVTQYLLGSERALCQL